MKKIFGFIGFIGFMMWALSAGCHRGEGSGDCLLLFAGSYSDADSAGIRIFSFDQATGAVAPLGQAGGVSNPSFIAVDGKRRLIYAVGEDAGLSSTANVLSYSSDGQSLELLQSEPTGGGAPCHIALSPDGGKLLTANYMGGSISVFPLDSKGMIADGAEVIQFYGRGADSVRQSQPHLHQISFVPGTNALLANDLGRDKIYMIDSPYVGQRIREISVAPGSGPRHTVFGSGGKYAYMLTEISGEIMVFDTSDGQLSPIQTVTADTLGAQGSADIHLSPDGRFLYASNRLQGDGLAIFSVDSVSGVLTRVGYQSTGAHPRNFAISPNGKYLLVACRDTDAIEIYRRNIDNGSLKLDTIVAMPKPTCLIFN